MKVVIDRFEDAFAVCEKQDRTIINIKKTRLPQEVKEGDILNIIDDEISVDIAETEKRKKEIEESTKDLWN